MDEGVDSARRLAAGAERQETALADPVQDAFGHDGAGGIVVAEEMGVYRAFHSWRSPAGTGPHGSGSQPVAHRSWPPPAARPRAVQVGRRSSSPLGRPGRHRKWQDALWRCGVEIRNAKAD